VPSPIVIDGSHGEGGGQLLRTAVALAAITGRALEIDHVRARRAKPGLAPQHMAAVRAVAALCGAQVDGVALRSQALTFVPGGARGETFDFDVGTAGSVTLVLQALLPVLIARGEAAEIAVRGGTDVRMAPPLDYFREVTLQLLARMGVRTELVARRRGYYPRGGGEVALRLQHSRLHPTAFACSGLVHRIDGLAHVARIDRNVAVRMRDACLAELSVRTGVRTEIDIAELASEQALGSGGAIVAWTRTDSTVLGAGRVAERGVRAETLGAAVAEELGADLAAGVGLDVHAADQMPVYLALAGGGSFSTRWLSSHAQTAIWLIEQFLPVRFDATSEGARVCVRATARAEALP